MERDSRAFCWKTMSSDPPSPWRKAIWLLLSDSKCLSHIFAYLQQNNMICVCVCGPLSVFSRVHESQSCTVGPEMDRQTTGQCEVLLYGEGRNLSFPALVHQYGRCFLKDGSRGLSNRLTNYLNCCLFCLPPPGILGLTSNI